MAATVSAFGGFDGEGTGFSAIADAIDYTRRVLLISSPGKLRRSAVVPT